MPTNWFLLPWRCMATPFWHRVLIIFRLITCHKSEHVVTMSLCRWQYLKLPRTDRPKMWDLWIILHTTLKSGIPFFSAGRCFGCRVDSFVFLLVLWNTKLYETGHCFAEFRSFRKTEKNTKVRKKYFELFRETAKQSFVSHFRIFSFQFVHSLRNLWLLLEFRIFYSSFVLFKSSFIPFIVLFKLYKFLGVAYLFYQNVRFVFSYIFVTILYILFEFHNFYSSFVPFTRVSYFLIEFHTF